jgi:hypothetical protein
VSQSFDGVFGHHGDVTTVQAPATDQAQLAREIGEALLVRDHARARSLIAEGAALFGHAAMVAAVEEQAREARS